MNLGEDVGDPLLEVLRFRFGQTGEMDLDMADPCCRIAFLFRIEDLSRLACFENQNGMHGKMNVAVGGGDFPHDGIVEKRHVAVGDGQNRNVVAAGGNALDGLDADDRPFAFRAVDGCQCMGGSQRQHIGRIGIEVVMAGAAKKGSLEPAF